MNSPPLDKPQWAPWLTPLRFAGLMCLLLLAAYPNVLLGVGSFYYRDYGVWAYPYVSYQHACFWRGELPLWNPLNNCGVPLLAQWNAMTLYPFSLIYLIFPLPWSLTYFCFGHLLLGSLGMYFLALRWTGSRFAAAFSGAASIFNGVAVSSLLWPHYTIALSWIPWVALTTERARSLGGRAVVIAAAVAALQLLAGAPEIAFLTWVLVATLWLHALITKADDRPTARRLFFIILLAAGLVAVQLLPFIDLLLHSQRDHTFSVAKWAMPSWGWGNFLVPLFHCFETPQGPFFQQGQEFFGSYYLGCSLVALAAWSLWNTRDSRIWILTGLSLLAVLLALGENGFLFPLTKRVFPLANIARYPVKFLILPAFALPLVGAFGIARLESRGNNAQDQRFLGLASLITAGLIGLVLLFAKLHPFPYDQWPVVLRNGIVRVLFLALFTVCLLMLCRAAKEKSKALLGIVLLLLIFADIRTHTPEQNPSLPTDAFTPGLWQARAGTPGPHFGQSRVFITPDAERHLFSNNVRNAVDQFLGQRLALWSNLHLLDGIPKVNGSSTLQIREQKQLEKCLYEQTNALPSGLLDFLGVSHISSSENLVEWSTRSNYCAFITAGQQPQFADQESTLRGLLDPDFDPRKTLFLSPDWKPPAPLGSCVEVQISEPQVSSHRISFNATAAQPALCAIAQTFYHCWKVSIDGRPAPLLRANGAFQAVFLPPGAHQVLLRYQDPMFCSGLAISITTLAICGISWRIARPKKEEAA